jgi:hypothetical protein
MVCHKQGNQGDSRLLVVGSQIGNLTSNPSFGHNLCLRCPNGSCEPIVDIYVPKSFQWYKELFNPIGFDPCNCFLKIRKSIVTLAPNVGGAHLGVWGFIPSHSPALLGFLLARTHVSPCLGREPKAKVAILQVMYNIFSIFISRWVLWHLSTNATRPHIL